MTKKIQKIKKIKIPCINIDEDQKSYSFKLCGFFSLCYQTYSRIDLRKLYTEYINSVVKDIDKLKNFAIVKKIPITILPDTLCCLAILLSNNIILRKKDLENFDLNTEKVLQSYKQLTRAISLHTPKLAELPPTLTKEIKEILLDIDCIEKTPFTMDWLKKYNLNKRQLKAVNINYTNLLKKLEEKETEVEVEKYKKYKYIISSLLEVSAGLLKKKHQE